MASQPSALSVRPHAPRRRQHTAHICPYLSHAARPWAGGGIRFGGDDQQADGDVSREAMATAGTRRPGTGSTKEEPGLTE
jgi:hypothetical protein